MPGKLLSIQELADFLSVPLSSIYGWRGRGFGPPAIKVGRSLRWRPADVDEWLTTNATNQSARR
jgi:excisionase family DNA binding protein